MTFDKFENLENVTLQGLTGMGLVGYNILKYFKKATGAAVVRRGFWEYFPNIAIIENGTITIQGITLWEMSVDDINFFILEGIQPRSDELASAFLKDIGEYFQEELNVASPIDLYVSFGAWVSSLEIPKSIKEEERAKTAKQIINREVSSEKTFYMATTKNLDKMQFRNAIEENNDGIKLEESTGYINGLNGVLPAYISAKTDIPTATIMISMKTPEFSQSSFLAQYMGMLSSLEGLKFLEKTFGLSIPLQEKIREDLHILHQQAELELTTVLSTGIPQSTKSSDNLYE